jgi:hypothetical protein
MIIYSGHECGVKITKDIVGKTFFDHRSACEGKLVKLCFTKVDYTHAYYSKENGENGSVSLSEQKRNWGIIDFEKALVEIVDFFDNKITEKRKKIEKLEKRMEELENQQSVVVDVVKPSDSNLISGYVIEEVDGKYTRFFSEDLVNTMLSKYNKFKVTISDMMKTLSKPSQTWYWHPKKYYPAQYDGKDIKITGEAEYIIWE